MAPQGSDGAHLPNPLPCQKTGWGLFTMVEIHKAQGLLIEFVQQQILNLS